MNYLIDTPVLLWMSGDDAKLSTKAKAILQSKDNLLYISLMSFWEIAIKNSSGKLGLDISLNELLSYSIRNKIELLPVVFSDFEVISKMTFPKINGQEHRDPFDRIIIAQAIANRLSLLSCDEKFDMYPEIIRIW